MFNSKVMLASQRINVLSSVNAYVIEKKSIWPTAILTYITEKKLTLSIFIVKSKQQLTCTLRVELLLR